MENTMKITLEHKKILIATITSLRKDGRLVLADDLEYLFDEILKSNLW